MPLVGARSGGGCGRAFEARRDRRPIQRTLSDHHQRRLARFALPPRPVEPGVEAGADGLNGEPRRGAGESSETLETQHVVGTDGPLDGGEQRLAAGGGGQGDGEAVEIVVLVALAVMLELVMALTAGEVVFAGEAEAEQRRDVDMTVACPHQP